MRDLSLVSADSPVRIANPIYAEVGPQHLLQAFLQRIVISGGRIEREYGLGRGRTDLLIIWPHPCRKDPHAAGRFVIECKVLRKSLEPTIRRGPVGNIRRPH